MGVIRCRGLPPAFYMFVMSLVVVSASTGYEHSVPKTEGETVNKILAGIIGQGLIYCQSGPTLIPLIDGIARITCLAVDKKGYETAPFSILSCPADAKGYYFATLSRLKLEEGWKLKECKSPMKNSCNIASNVNKGITGALLSSPRLLKTMKLSDSVQPFIYTSKAPAISPFSHA